MTNIVNRSDLRAAIDSDPMLCNALVRRLAPVIRRRVLRAVARSRHFSARGAGSPQDVEDLVQEVLIALFDKDARALRAWDPERGASLVTFVAVVADRRIASILRSARRRPWSAEVPSNLEIDTTPARDALPDARVTCREHGRRLVDRLRAELSPRGLELFLDLLVYEESVATICEARKMSPEAVWAWRCRLKKLVRKLAGEIEGSRPGSASAAG